MPCWCRDLTPRIGLEDGFRTCEMLELRERLRFSVWQSLIPWLFGYEKPSERPINAFPMLCCEIVFSRCVITYSVHLIIFDHE